MYHGEAGRREVELEAGLIKALPGCAGMLQTWPPGSSARPSPFQNHYRSLYTRTYVDKYKNEDIFKLPTEPSANQCLYSRVKISSLPLTLTRNLQVPLFSALSYTVYWILWSPSGKCDPGGRPFKITLNQEIKQDRHS